jgi:hypothetical protein
MALRYKTLLPRVSFHFPYNFRAEYPFSTNIQAYTGVCRTVNIRLHTAGRSDARCRQGVYNDSNQSRFAPNAGSTKALYMSQLQYHLVPTISSSQAWLLPFLPGYV